MMSKEEKQKKIERLQENLESIRKIAGWSMEELGDLIGVSKQTVSNWEKDSSAKSASINYTQYIAIRAVIDCEIQENDNKLLEKVVTVLLDSDEEYDEEEYQKTQTGVKAIAALAAGGIAGAQLMAHASALLPVIGAGIGMATPATLGAAIGATALGPVGWLGGIAVATGGYWLRKSFNKNNKKRKK